MLTLQERLTCFSWVRFFGIPWFVLPIYFHVLSLYYVYLYRPFPVTTLECQRYDKCIFIYKLFHGGGYHCLCVARWFDLKCLSKQLFSCDNNVTLCHWNSKDIVWTRAVADWMNKINLVYYRNYKTYILHLCVYLNHNCIQAKNPIILSWWRWVIILFFKHFFNRKPFFGI